MQTNQKKVVKVTFLGETKRLKGTTEYKALVDQTLKAFGQGILPTSFKFFYLDEDNEIISINSQSDLEEALSIEDFNVLKLQIATSVGEARSQLVAQYSDTISMKESLNQSGFFSQAQVPQFEMGPIAQSPVITQAQNTQRFDKRGLLESGFEVLSERPDDVMMSARDEVPEPIVKVVPQQVNHKEPTDQNKLIESVQVPKKEEVSAFAPEEPEVQEPDSIEQVMDVVRGEIKQYCNRTFPSLIKDYLKKKAEDQAQVEHPEFICDNCGMDPIKGIRFKCSVRPDFDLCEKCEAQGNHEHPFLKIRHPSQAPNSFLCQYNPVNADGTKMTPMQMEEKKAEQKVTEDKARGFGTKKNTEKAKFIKYSGRFVKESFGDKHPVVCGSPFTKQWTLRNDGKTAWPEDTIFVQTNGDDLKIQPATIESIVEPEGEYTWTLNGEAPTKPGRYSAYFRMVTGNNYRFGHKVWVDILVEEKVVPAQMEIDEQPEPAQSIFDEGEVNPLQNKNATEVIYPDLDMSVQDKMGGDNVESEPASVEDLMKSVSRTPKQVYYEKVAHEQNETTRTNLKTLFDLGFVNFEVNAALLQKQCNNVETVAATLCEGMLSESCIQAVFNKKD